MQVAQSSFTSYVLTEQEQLSGSMLSYEQKLFIQNQIGGIAEQKLALIPTPNDYQNFIQQEAFLSGQLAILKYLLDSSLASEQAVLDKQQEVQQ